jgi:uncharacterized membrane protein
VWGKVNKVNTATRLSPAGVGVVVTHSHIVVVIAGPISLTCSRIMLSKTAVRSGLKDLMLILFLQSYFALQKGTKYTMLVCGLYLPLWIKYLLKDILESIKSFVKNLSLVNVCLTLSFFIARCSYLEWKKK